MTRPFPILLLMAGVGLVPAAAGRSGMAQGHQTNPPDGSLPAGGALTADPQAPMQMTGDTMEYCMQLEHRISADPKRTAEVRQLVRQGHQLCDHGQVRLGLTKMRRAFMMLRQNQQLLIQP